MSAIFRRTPVGPSPRNSLRGIVDVGQTQRAVVFVVAELEDAEDGELLQPRHDAGRRDLALRRDQRDLVADAQRRARARAAAEDDAELAGLQRVSGSPRTVLPKSATLGSASGSMPRTSTPRTASPRVSSALRRDERRGADRPRGLRRAARDRLPPVDRAHRPDASNTSMCETTDSMRSRTSFSNPFITDSTTISAATPSAIPAIEMPRDERNEAVAPARPAGARVAQADAEFVGKIQGYGSERRARLYASTCVRRSQRAARVSPALESPMQLTVMLAGALLPADIAAPLVTRLDAPDARSARCARGRTLEQSVSPRGAAVDDWLERRRPLPSRRRTRRADLHRQRRDSAAIWRADPMRLASAAKASIVGRSPKLPLSDAEARCADRGALNETCRDDGLVAPRARPRWFLHARDACAVRRRRSPRASERRRCACTPSGDELPLDSRCTMRCRCCCTPIR